MILKIASFSSLSDEKEAHGEGWVLPAKIMHGYVIGCLLLREIKALDFDLPRVRRLF